MSTAIRRFLRKKIPLVGAGLVHLVAQDKGITVDLGLKGKRGFRQYRATRTAFLTDPTHRLVFHFTPQHCSWLNQIKLGFGVLRRKRLKRGNFLSQADLKTRLLEFIAYFNRTMAKPGVA